MQKTAMPPRRTAEDPRDDPFVNALLRRMPEETAATFTRSQLKAITRALDRKGPKHDRPIFNVRTAFSLYFTRLYFVFLLGRDRRERQQHVEIDRRADARSNVMFLFGFLGLLLVCGLIFVFLYYLKRVLGIDFLENWHIDDTW